MLAHAQTQLEEETAQEPIGSEEETTLEEPTEEVPNSEETDESQILPVEPTEEDSVEEQQSEEESLQEEVLEEEPLLEEEPVVLANEAPLLGAPQVNGEPSFTVKYGFEKNGEVVWSTEDEIVVGRVGYFVGEATLYVRYELTYENVNPSTSYMTGIIAVDDNGNVLADLNWTEWRPDSSGSGTRSGVLRPRMGIGSGDSINSGSRFYVEMLLIPSDGSGTIYPEPAEGYVPYLLAGGVSMAYPVIPEDKTLNQVGFRGLLVEGTVGKEGFDLSAKLRALEMRPDVTYVAELQLAEIVREWDEERQTYNTYVRMIGDVVTREFTVDSYDYQEIILPYGFVSGLEPGQAYAIARTVYVKGDPNQKYWAMDPFYTDEGTFHVADPLPLPDEGDKYVKWTFSNWKKESPEEPLKGVQWALFSVDEEGNETQVATWASDGNPVTMELPVGKYILKENQTVEPYLPHEPVSFELTEEEAVRSTEQYIGYSSGGEVLDEEGVIISNIILLNGETMERQVSYCINHDVNGPHYYNAQSRQYYTYEEMASDPQAIANLVQNKTITPEELMQALRRMVYNGYPNNSSGIQEKYGLAPAEFHEVTQYAIHHFTDAIDWPASVFNENRFYQAYSELINCQKDPPEGTNIRVYAAQGDYQNLVVTAMVDETYSSELKVYHVKEEEPEEETPPPPEKPEEETPPPPEKPEEETPPPPPTPKREVPQTSDPVNDIYWFGFLSGLWMCSWLIRKKHKEE